VEFYAVEDMLKSQMKLTKTVEEVLSKKNNFFVGKSKSKNREILTLHGFCN